MIKLTQPNGRDVWLSAEHILCCGTFTNQSGVVVTRVMLGSEFWVDVTEDPEIVQIARSLVPVGGDTHITVHLDAGPILDDTALIDSIRRGVNTARTLPIRDLEEKT